MMTKQEIMEEKREAMRRERLNEYFNGILRGLLAETQEESMARFRREVGMNTPKNSAKYLTTL